MSRPFRNAIMGLDIERLMPPPAASPPPPAASPGASCVPLSHMRAFADWRAGADGAEKPAGAEGVAKPAADAKTPEPTKAVEKAGKPSPAPEEFVRQLQKLFGHLMFSEKKFYDTISFCHSFKMVRLHSARACAAWRRAMA